MIDLIDLLVNLARHCFASLSVESMLVLLLVLLHVVGVGVVLLEVLLLLLLSEEIMLNIVTILRFLIYNRAAVDSKFD